MKFILKHGKSEKDIRNLRQEIEILRQLRHENIIQMLDAFETKTDFCVVTGGLGWVGCWVGWLGGVRTAVETAESAFGTCSPRPHHHHRTADTQHRQTNNHRICAGRAV
jgi:hypothetical protein